MVYEYSGGGNFTYTFPTSSFTIVGSVGYHFMIATGDLHSGIYIGLDGPTEVKTHFVLVCIGGQWEALTEVLAPWIGVNVLGGSFGKISRSVSNSGGLRDLSYGGGTSFGFGVTIGEHFQIIPLVCIDLNVSQNRYGFFKGMDPLALNLNCIGISASELFFM